MLRPKHTLAILLVLCISACEKVVEPVAAEPGEETRPAIVAPVPRTVVPATKEELANFELWALDSRAFLAVYGGNLTGEELQQYETAFETWQDTAEKTISESEVVHLVGGYLGQRMVKDFDMEWVKVNDSSGQKFAVRHKLLDVMAYPFASVKKRIADREYDFKTSLYQVIKDELESGRAKPRRSELDGAR